MAARMKEFADLEYVEKIPRELICSICIRVLCEPHLVNCCEQQFCKDCLETWLEDNASCPHCRSSGFSHMFMKQTNRKVGELKVYCPNKHHGCKAQLKISEYQNHLSTANDKGCTYIELDCPNNCTAKVLRGKMLEHRQKLCPKRIVPCVYCKLKGEYLSVVTEHLKECSLMPVGCPLACGANVLRKDLQTHRNECPLELVPCSFSGLGCKTKVRRKDLKEHVDSSGMSHHMTLLAKSHMTIQAEHTVLQMEHTTLNDVCTSLQAEHITLQADHQQLLKEHTALKDTCTSLRKDHEAFVKLESSCADINKEQLALIADHNTLKDTCKSLQKELAALQKSQRQLQNEHTELSAALQEALKHPLQLTTPVLSGSQLTTKMSTASKPPTKTPDNSSIQTPGNKSTPPFGNVTLGKKSKQTLGNTIYLSLGQDGESGDHTIVLRNITLKLEWELDDLFTQSHIEDVLLTLYLLNSVATETCSFEVQVSSGYGDSGQLAIVCCGQPQTTMWGGMPTNASKKLVGSLSLQCDQQDQLKVSLRHHQGKACKCSCHITNSDSEELFLDTFPNLTRVCHPETNFPL